jgi:diguanylate cyclase (GGDEF)-like protein
VIFVTAKNEECEEELGLNLGAVDYITKPFSVPITMARIRNHIRLKQQADLLESISLVDALTGMPNRRRFDEAIEAEWKRAAREKTQLSMLMIDIDHFKQYNDHYGHGAGDACLQLIAAALLAGVSRPADLVARYGGEEFVAILSNTDRKAAVHIATRLCESIRDLKLPHAHSGVASFVTVSIGCATMIPTGETSSSKALFDEADKMLYKAKNSGRNRVC